MKIRAHDVALQSAHFLVKDTESIVDLQLTVLSYSFPKQSVIWQHIKPDGTIDNVRPPALSARLSGRVRTGEDPHFGGSF
jgi:hypothetical protein